jgi:hypothetical protein
MSLLRLLPSLPGMFQSLLRVLMSAQMILLPVMLRCGLVSVRRKKVQLRGPLVSVFHSPLSSGNDDERIGLVCRIHRCLHAPVFQIKIPGVEQTRSLNIPHR